MTGKELLKLLQKNGWRIARIKGSHHIMIHDQRPGVIVPVPVHGREIGTGTAHAIMKQAGIQK